MSYFRVWKIFHIVVSETLKNSSRQIQIILRKRNQFSTISSLQSVFERRRKLPSKYLETRILRISWRNLRIFRILGMMRRKLGPACGVNKLYLQRGFTGWINAWKKRNKISYACHLLQNTIDRFTVRKALNIWPGWREYRKSEEMKMRLLVEKRGRGRLLGILGFAEGVREREKEYKKKERKNTSTFALFTSPSISFIRQKKVMLSLAERVAIEATYLICDDYHKYRAIQYKCAPPLGGRDIAQLQLQDEAELAPKIDYYTTALSLATSLLSERLGEFVSNKQSIGNMVNNKHRNLNMDDCTDMNDFNSDSTGIYSCSITDKSTVKNHKYSRNCNHNIDGHEGNNSNDISNSNSELSHSKIRAYCDQSEETLDLLFESLRSSDKENKVKYNNKNIRMEDPESTVKNRIGQAVKEVLVLLIIVMSAWKKATQALIGRRMKGRILSRMVDEVIKVQNSKTYKMIIKSVGQKSF